MLHGVAASGPSKDTEALALAVWAARARRMKVPGCVQMALSTLRGASTYCQPDGLLDFRAGCRCPPPPGITSFGARCLFPEEKEKRNKTGPSGVSLKLDSAWLRFANPLGVTQPPSTGASRLVDQRRQCEGCEAQFEATFIRPPVGRAWEQPR